MMTFQAWLQQAIARLAESDSPRRDAEILLGHVSKPGAHLDPGLRRNDALR